MTAKAIKVRRPLGRRNRRVVQNMGAIVTLVLRIALFWLAFSVVGALLSFLSGHGIASLGSFTVLGIDLQWSTIAKLASGFYAAAHVR